MSYISCICINSYALQIYVHNIKDCHLFIFDACLEDTNRFAT